MSLSLLRLNEKWKFHWTLQSSRRCSLPMEWMRNSQNSANLANSIQVALFVFFLFFAYMQSPRRTNKQAQKKSNHICSKSNELENLSSTAHITYYANLGLAAVVHFSLWNTHSSSRGENAHPKQKIYIIWKKTIIWWWIEGKGMMTKCEWKRRWWHAEKCAM